LPARPPASYAAIDLVEAAYNLELPPAEWLPNVLRAGEPLLDFGMGYYGAIGSGASEQGVPIVTQVQAAEGAEELPVQIMRAAQEVGPDVVKIASAASLGRVVVLSETRNQWPQAYEALTRNVGCKDMLSLTAVDPDHRGVNISIPSPELIELDPKQRWRWQMIEAHLAAGHRLRRSLDGQSTAPGVPMTEFVRRRASSIKPVDRFETAIPKKRSGYGKGWSGDDGPWSTGSTRTAAGSCSPGRTHPASRTREVSASSRRRSRPTPLTERPAK